MSLLVLTPAIEILVRVFSPAFAAFRTARPGLRVRVWLLYLRLHWLDRKGERLDLKNAHLKQRVEAKLSDSERQFRHNREGIRAARQFLAETSPDDPRRADTTKYLDAAEAWEREQTTWADRVRDALANQRAASWIEESDEYLRELDRIRQDIKKVSAADRQATIDLLEQIPIAMNPVIPPPEGPHRNGTYVTIQKAPHARTVSPTKAPDVSIGEGPWARSISVIPQSAPWALRGPVTV